MLYNCFFPHNTTDYRFTFLIIALEVQKSLSVKYCLSWAYLVFAYTLGVKYEKPLVHPRSLIFLPFRVIGVALIFGTLSVELIFIYIIV